MTTTTTELRPERSRRMSLSWIAPAVLALAAVVLVVNLSTSVPTRRNITMVNRSDATVTLEVTNRPGGERLGVGTIDPTSREVASAVIDPGSVWRFQLSVGPDQLGEIVRTADQMAASHWTVTIPADAADRLPALQRTG